MGVPDLEWLLSFFQGSREFFESFYSYFMKKMHVNIPNVFFIFMNRFPMGLLDLEQLTVSIILLTLTFFKALDNTLLLWRVFISISMAISKFYVIFLVEILYSSPRDFWTLNNGLFFFDFKKASFSRFFIKHFSLFLKLLSFIPR